MQSSILLRHLRVGAVSLALFFLALPASMLIPAPTASAAGEMLLAQSSKKKKKKRKKRKKSAKTRKRTLIGEKRFRYKKGDKTDLDFEAADISGARKTPLGSIVDTVQANRDYDFVKVRLRWTPEMVQSASSLETGKSSK